MQNNLLRLVLVCLLAALLLPAACTGQPAGKTPSATPITPATTTSTPAAPATTTATPAPAVPSPFPTQTPLLKPTPTPQPVPSPSSAPQFSVETVVRNLNIPWAIDFAPDGRIFITERAGQVRIVKDGSLLTEPWITLDVAAVGEGGLLGLALDPRFEQNRFVFVAYTYRTADGRLQNRLDRLREEPSGKGVADKVIVDGVAGGNVHDGGRVKFGTDGKLYWTMGETGKANLAQDTSSLNGKILRYNPDGSIPPDNPFPNSPVYSYGNRNPQGLAWQKDTGRLYATEHGPSGGIQGSAKDEVNFIEPGKNYGWPVIAGDETREGMVSPVLQSGSETWAPSRATFVNGGPWDGSLLFTGLRGNTLYRLVLDRIDPRQIITFEKLLTGQYGRLRDVVQGPDGAIYILTSNRDGRGQPVAEDDRLLRLSFK